MKRLLHQLAHLLGWNQGRILAWYEDDVLCVGFVCDGCGQMLAWHKTDTKLRQGQAVRYIPGRVAVHSACRRPYRKACPECQGTGIVTPRDADPRPCDCCGCKKEASEYVG